MLKKILPILTGCLLVSQLAWAALPLAVVGKAGKKGCIDSSGKEVIPLQYSAVEIATPEEGDFLAVQKDGKYGLYAKDGRQLLAPTLDKMTAPGEGIVGGLRGTQWNFYTVEGRRLFGGFTGVGIFSEGLVPVQKGELWGYADKTGKLVIDYQYKEAREFHEGLAAVKKNKFWGYIKPDGSELLLANLRGATDFQNGLAVVDGNWIMDKTGKRVAKIRNYSYIGNFNKEGLLEVGARRRTSSILDYISIGLGTGGWWGWGLDAGGFGVGGSFGGHHHHHHHSSFGGFISASPGLLMPSNMHRGYVNNRGVELISPDNDYVSEFVNGYALVKNERRWGMVAPTGETVIPYVYDKLTPFYNGLAAFEFDTLWGYIDEGNNIVIKNRFNKVTPFFTDYAAVLENDKAGIIDKKGTLLFTPAISCKEVGPVQQGLAAFKEGKHWGFLNLKGQVVIKAQYDSVSMFQ